MERQRRNMVSVDADRGDGSAPENSFGHVRALGSPELKTIVMSNNDTLSEIELWHAGVIQAPKRSLEYEIYSL
jgi:hypothetical protein